MVWSLEISSVRVVSFDEHVYSQYSVILMASLLDKIVPKIFVCFLYYF